MAASAGRAPRLSRRARLVILISCGVLGVLLAALAWLVRDGHGDARRALDERFAARASLTAAFTRDYVNELARREQREAERLLAGDRPDQRMFEQVVQAFGFEAAVLLDSDGRLLQVWPRKPDLLGRDMTSQYPHLRAAVAGEIGVSEVVPSAALGRPIAAVAVPFHSRAGRRVFSGAFAPNAAALGAYLKSAVPIAGGNAYLIDRSGRLLAAGRTDRALEQEVTQLGDGVHTLRTADEEVTVAVTSVADTPWRVALSAPGDALYAPVAEGAVAAWGLWIGLALAGITAVALLVRLARAHADAAEAARTDALTHLPNRRSMQEAIEREIAHATRHSLPLAVLIVDLDHFKAVNDTLGHDAGDAVLRSTANALRTAIRTSDVVGRWGGEEFLLLLPHTDLTAAFLVAERIRGAVATPVTASRGRTVSVTASIGLAVLSDADSRALVDAADAALYDAKAAGRDRTVAAAAKESAGSPP